MYIQRFYISNIQKVMTVRVLFVRKEDLQIERSNAVSLMTLFLFCPLVKDKIKSGSYAFKHYLTNLLSD